MRDLLQTPVPKLEDLLDESLMARITARGRDVHYADGQVINRRGDLKPGISIVRSGRAVARIVGLDGSVLTNSTLGPGHCFGEFTLFAGLPRTHDISALGETTVTQVPGARFMELFDNEPVIARALLTISLVRSYVLIEFTDDLRRLPLPARIAKFLLGGVPEAKTSHTVPCRQDELAFTFGVSRVSIGKALKTLENLGFLELGYGRIGLPDVAAFRAWIDRQNLITPLAAAR